MDFALTPAKVGKQFQMAENVGAPLAVIYGAEWPMVKIKKLVQREETQVMHDALTQAREIRSGSGMTCPRFTCPLFPSCTRECACPRSCALPAFEVRLSSTGAVQLPGQMRSQAQPESKEQNSHVIRPSSVPN